MDYSTRVLYPSSLLARKAHAMIGPNLPNPKVECEPQTHSPSTCNPGRCFTKISHLYKLREASQFTTNQNSFADEALAFAPTWPPTPPQHHSLRSPPHPPTTPYA